MVHGHNERLVSVSFVFVKDGCAVLVDRQKSNHCKKTKRSLPSFGEKSICDFLQCETNEFKVEHFDSLMHFVSKTRIVQQIWQDFEKLNNNKPKWSSNQLNVNYEMCYADTLFNTYHW